MVCVSADLPFAQSRFCGAEGIENGHNGIGVPQRLRHRLRGQMVDGPLSGLLARAVVVLDEHGTVTYTELVPEIAQEPDYDAALAALD